MDASTTRKRTRIEQCRTNANAKSEQKRQAAFAAIAVLQQERRSITKAAVARRAGVSVVFLRKHHDLLQAIEEAERAQPTLLPAASSIDRAKDQVIAALRRWLEELKQQLANKDNELRQKQRDLDRLYGKLAAGSPLTDAELRCALTEALERLKQVAEPHANTEQSKVLNVPVIPPGQMSGQMESR